ncbi:acyl-CoA dehydrogenase family protein [Heyndrickxia ginsengihumi]|uniref:acyl-CoA dehydrogenase family protein n=1 Tax=Heyndrickxia ginsengihumi TaxID=363870 RepID=UPI000472C66C|nr:acyl-CoA dehydrogenase family protein [Heyndrickxia ginsengihumi]
MTTISKSYLEEAIELKNIFATDAVEREKNGKVPKKQRDLLRNSNLLNLIIPKQYGGIGENWSTALRIVREFAKVDGSIAHLYGYHFLQLVNPHFGGNQQEKAFYYQESAKHNWFWGNAYNFLDLKLTGKRVGDSWVLKGKKSFSTGSEDADKLLVGFIDEERDEQRIAIIDTERKGVHVHGDWDGLGQRQTGSGSVSFDHVIVNESELLHPDKKSPFSTFSAILSQIILANVFLGSAEGALETAKNYTTTKTKPWFSTGLEKAVDDPYIQRRYGEFWINVQSAAALVEKANKSVDESWIQEHQLTEKQRGETALLTGAANAHVSKVALDVTANIYEVMGARSANNSNGFDRFFRNVRTHTLHNPLEYKRKNIGNWYLTEIYPIPTDYS